MKRFALNCKVMVFVLMIIALIGSMSCAGTKDNEKRRSEVINSVVLKELNNLVEDIENQTHRKIIDKQRKLIEGSLNRSDVYKIDSETIKVHRNDFDKRRKALIKEWEDNVGEKWPKYDNDVVIKRKIVRRKGQNYDAHHIIELSWSGENAWWNLTPAAYPKEHQQGIHRKGGVSAKLFGEIPDYVGE